MAKVVHFEIPVDEPERAIAFYRAVLGWEVQQFPDSPYWLVQAGGDDEPGANGALVARNDLQRVPVLIAGVADLEATLVKAQAAGVEVLQGKQPIPGVGWSAYVRDSEGNTLGLFQPDMTGGPPG